MATQNIFNLTDTWNNVATTFTAIKMNATDTASAAGSALMDLQVGGASQFSVSKAGAVSTTGRVTVSGADSVPARFIRTVQTARVDIFGNAASTNGDIVAQLDLRGLTSTGVEGVMGRTRAVIDSNTNGALFTHLDLIVQINNTQTVVAQVGNNFVKINPVAFASLPAAATAGVGARAFVTDALTTLALGIGTTVLAGGANKVPVHSDGTNWIYG
jgi:hypothetical protein